MKKTSTGNFTIPPILRVRGAGSKLKVGGALIPEIFSLCPHFSAVPPAPVKGGTACAYHGGHKLCADILFVRKELVCKIADSILDETSIEIVTRHAADIRPSLCSVYRVLLLNCMIARNLSSHTTSSPKPAAAAQGHSRPAAHFTSSHTTMTIFVTV